MRRDEEGENQAIGGVTAWRWSGSPHTRSLVAMCRGPGRPSDSGSRIKPTPYRRRKRPSLQAGEGRLSSVVLTGRPRYKDGKPAGGVQIAAQVRDEATEAFIKPGSPPGDLKGEQEEIWNNAVGKLDGSYNFRSGQACPTTLWF